MYKITILARTHARTHAAPTSLPVRGALRAFKSRVLLARSLPLLAPLLGSVERKPMYLYLYLTSISIWLFIPTYAD